MTRSALSVFLTHKSVNLTLYSKSRFEEKQDAVCGRSQHWYSVKNYKACFRLQEGDKLTYEECEGLENPSIKVGYNVGMRGYNHCMGRWGGG